MDFKIKSHKSYPQENIEQEPIKIFYCYAHEDKDLRDRLASHLEPLRQRGLIVPWYDREISAGKEWLREIYLHLDTTDIVLALVSPDFMNSTYCTGSEMQRARERQLIGSTRIIPVLLRSVSWEKTFLGEFQALPKNGSPIKDWRSVDRGFREVAEGIEQVVHELRRTKTLRDQEASQRACDRGIDLFELAHEKPGYYEEAFQCFQQSLCLDQGNMIAWVGLAYTLLQLGRLSDALIACNHFLQYSIEEKGDRLFLTALEYKHFILLTQGCSAEAEDMVREFKEYIPELQLQEWREERFTSSYLKIDPSGGIEERGLPYLDRNEKEGLFITSGSRHYFSKSYQVEIQNDGTKKIVDKADENKNGIE